MIEIFVFMLVTFLFWPLYLMYLVIEYFDIDRATLSYQGIALGTGLIFIVWTFSIRRTLHDIFLLMKMEPKE